MHIIYIHTHDTGRYIEPYGYGIKTPRLMALAKEGTLFRHAYCASPSCSASRSALLTGMTPHSNGMLGLAHRGFQLHDPGKHLSNVLADQGYTTVLCGIQHESSDVSLLGYGTILHDRRTGSLEDWDRNNAERAARYLRDYAAKDNAGPLFLSFGLGCTHREFPVHHAVNPNYVLPPLPMYDCAVNRADAAAFAASAAVADECIGTVLDALEDSGLADNAMIFFTTDHGIAFPLMKSSLYDTGIGVSLIVKYPGNRMAGRATDALVSQLDLFPTVCDYAGIAKPEWLQGTTLMPLLEGAVSSVRKELYAELNFHAAKEPMRCVRTERFKLIRRYEPAPHPLPANTDDGPSKDFLIEAGWLNQQPAQEMLFDLYLDPMERNNLYTDPRYAAIREDLTRRLERWMLETGDPLIEGALIAPPGARVNKRSSRSPRDRDFEA